MSKENIDFNIKTERNYAVVEKAIKEYIAVRPKDVKEHDALFISKRGTRIGKRTVEVMVKKYIIVARFRP